MAQAPDKHTLLILEDEAGVRELLRSIFSGEGYEVLATDNGHEALDWAAKRDIDVVVQDVRMPKMGGIEFLQRFREIKSDVPVIVITAFVDWNTAVEAMRLGAFDYIKKPFDTEALRKKIATAVDRASYYAAHPLTSDLFHHGDIIASTPAMRRVLDLVRRAAQTDSTVLIVGDSGTGKEQIARCLHTLSMRSKHSFLAANCGALTETLLESELFGHVRGSFTGAAGDREGMLAAVDGGTLFLDEIGEMSTSMQVKLLRVIENLEYKPVGSNQTKRVDVRFVAATHRNLLEMVKAGTFREDLFYRLNVIPLNLPPLRERRDDVPLLAGFLLAKFGKKFGRAGLQFDEKVLERLLQYPWPGNIRELENVIQRAVSLCDGDVIREQDLLLPQDAPAEVAAVTGGVTAGGSAP
ncbi:MAG TPA: sigma-54 dependent transcriptional regulator, partial [Planctomycetota bacterium]|nr:sigma-54 dependent transcriptional regulator [Planctomycetota bacterium]